MSDDSPLSSDDKPQSIGFERDDITLSSKSALMTALSATAMPWQMTALSSQISTKISTKMANR